MTAPLRFDLRVPRDRTPCMLCITGEGRWAWRPSAEHTAYTLQSDRCLQVQVFDTATTQRLFAYVDSKEHRTQVWLREADGGWFVAQYTCGVKDVEMRNLLPPPLRALKRI